MAKTKELKKSPLWGMKKAKNHPSRQFWKVPSRVSVTLSQFSAILDLRLGRRRT